MSRNNHDLERSSKTGNTKYTTAKIFGNVSRRANFTVDFTATNRQCDWLEISMVYDKSDNYNSVYDSWNAEVAASTIKSAALENISQSYGVSSELKFDVNDPTQKYLL